MSDLTLATRRLMKELSEIKAQLSPLVLKAEPKENNLFLREALIQGPSRTVYSEGKFKLEMKFSSHYPTKPPLVQFETRIFYCNVGAGGKICWDILKEQSWSPALTMSPLLTSIISLLSDCNPLDPLQHTVENLYLFQRNKHNLIAQKWVERYAKEMQLFLFE